MANCTTERRWEEVNEAQPESGESGDADLPLAWDESGNCGALVANCRMRRSE